MAYDPYYELVPEPEGAAVRPSPHGAHHHRPATWLRPPRRLMGRLAKEHGKPWLLQERWDFVDEILPSVRRLQDACRDAGIELIHVRVKYLTATTATVSAHSRAR